MLRLHDLLAYGVGSTVGAGIYSVIAVAVALSGPSVTISFLVCCLACICTGLVYAEFAVRIPQAGSAYTFAYTSFGGNDLSIIVSSLCHFLLTSLKYKHTLTHPFTHTHSLANITPFV